MLDRIREHVETRFTRFRNAVNGRLGFQYRQIVWDIADCPDRRLLPDLPGLFPSTAFQGLPHPRWEEASRLLDKLFRHRHVIVVGDGATGKTTMMTAFVVPQLRHISTNVFYAEIWDHPVHEIREAIGKADLIPPGGAVDIISICKKLLTGGPCFFIIDGCERLKTVESRRVGEARKVRQVLSRTRKRVPCGPRGQGGIFLVVQAVQGHEPVGRFRSWPRR